MIWAWAELQTWTWTFPFLKQKFGELCLQMVSSLSTRLTSLAVVHCRGILVLGVMIFFLQREPRDPLAEEIIGAWLEKYAYNVSRDPLFCCSPCLCVCSYPFAFTDEDTMMIGFWMDASLDISNLNKKTKRNSYNFSFWLLLSNLAGTIRASALVNSMKGFHKVFFYYFFLLFDFCLKKKIN